MSGHATRSAHRAVPGRTARVGKGDAKGCSRRSRVARAFVASSSVGSKRNRVSIGYRSRLGDAATPRADAKWPDRRETAGRRGAFRGRKEGDVPGDHSSLAICTLVYSVVPLGTAPAWKGRIVSRTVGRHVGDGASAERGGERTARLTRQREYRQRRDRLPVSCGRPRLRHDRLSGARARGAPLVLSRDVSRQQWRSHRKIAKGSCLQAGRKQKKQFRPSSIVPTGPSLRRDRASPRADRAGRRGLVPARQPAAARRGSRRRRQKSSLPPLRIELRTS